MILRNLGTYKKALMRQTKTIFPVFAVTLMAMLPTLIALQLKYSVNTEIASLLLQLQKLILMSAIKISIN